MVCGTTGDEGVTAERIASEVAARTGLRTSWSLKQHRTLLSHSYGDALGERMGSIRESLSLLFDEPDLQNMYRRWLATFQHKVPTQHFLLNAVVGLVPPASHAKFFVHMQDREGPRCVCMQCDGAERYNFFFDSGHTTVPALSLFTACERRSQIRAAFHEEDEASHGSAPLWMPPSPPKFIADLEHARTFKESNETKAARTQREHRGARHRPALYESFRVFLL